MHVYGDRKEHKEMGKTIVYLNEKIGIDSDRKWKAVIDFSSYKWRELQSIAKPLQNMTDIFIFISSDSIYNNSPRLDRKIKE